MIGNTFLAARVEPLVLDGRDALDSYVQSEFRGLSADALVEDAFRASQVPVVHLAGGRSGWVARARRVATMAAAFLLPSNSRRAIASRAAPNFVLASAEPITSPACCDASRT